jgi:hypothetical protein
MAFIAGNAAGIVGEQIKAVNGTTNFSFTGKALDRGMSAFDTLANSDTVAYKAVSADDPSKWEIGLLTYVASGNTGTRADATISASGNSGSRVDFTRADGSAGQVHVTGMPIQDIASGAGTPSDTATADVGASFNQTTLNNNFATLVESVNRILHYLIHVK